MSVPDVADVQRGEDEADEIERAAARLAAASGPAGNTLTHRIERGLAPLIEAAETRLRSESAGSPVLRYDDFRRLYDETRPQPDLVAYKFQVWPWRSGNDSSVAEVDE